MAMVGVASSTPANKECCWDERHLGYRGKKLMGFLNEILDYR